MPPILVVCVSVASFHMASESSYGAFSRSWTTFLARHQRSGRLGLSQQLGENYGEVVKLRGLLGARELFVFDPTAIHSILVKNPDIYEEMPKLLWHSSRSLLYLNLSLKRLIFGKGIFSTYLHERRKYRKIMMPAFSTANLRGMVPLFYEVAQRDRDGLIAPNVERNPQTLLQNASAISSPASHHEGLPPSFLQFMINLIPLPALHELRGHIDFTDATAANYIMSILVKQNASGASGLHLTDEELVASTSSVLPTPPLSHDQNIPCFGQVPDVQEKLRAEILGVPDQLDHDTLVALPYLDGVVREVLRLYPTASPVMYRETTTHAVLPLSTPITGVDGKIMQSIPVPKGTSIYISISAVNRNTQIWGEDALEFKPERWTNGRADSVTTKVCGIYGNTMTFMGGARSCIGFKFAQLEIKVVMCVLLRAFRFSTPDPRIKWRKTDALPSPYVDGQPQLPVVVEQLKT
ncbi:cytochrome P450 [Mycena leptocephala]|nr:cytochrome P450 [Mycena leptocephala]